jgi:hypothetical protein
MTRHARRSRSGARPIISALVLLALAALGLVSAPVAGAQPARPTAAPVLGTTTVSTVDGIAATLIKAGVLPLPVLPQTGFGLSFRGGLSASYRFPITSSTADLATGTGDLLHSGGIYFVSRRASLEIGKFDIDLAAGKVFATEVNFAPARIAVLDLDLSGLKVGSGAGGSTVLSGITAKLDPAAAGALNATFKLALPADGSLKFATAKVVLRG